MSRRTFTPPPAPPLEPESSLQCSAEDGLQPERPAGTDQATLHALASSLSEQGDLAEIRDHLLIAISQADISGFEGTKQALIAMLKDVEEELQSM